MWLHVDSGYANNQYGCVQQRNDRGRRNNTYLGKALEMVERDMSWAECDNAGGGVSAGVNMMHVVRNLLCVLH
jgi:hypothetical protein